MSDYKWWEDYTARFGKPLSADDVRSYENIFLFDLGVMPTVDDVRQALSTVSLRKENMGLKFAPSASQLVAAIRDTRAEREKQAGEHQPSNKYGFCMVCKNRGSFDTYWMVMESRYSPAIPCTCHFGHVHAERVQPDPDKRETLMRLSMRVIDKLKSRGLLNESARLSFAMNGQAAKQSESQAVECDVMDGDF